MSYEKMTDEELLQDIEHYKILGYKAVAELAKRYKGLLESHAMLQQNYDAIQAVQADVLYKWADERQKKRKLEEESGSKTEPPFMDKHERRAYRQNLNNDLSEEENAAL